MGKSVHAVLGVVILGLVVGCSEQQAETTQADTAPAEAVATAVDSSAIEAADPDVWLTHGRTYDEQRHSPLSQIDLSNVSELGLAWYFDMDTNRGVEATPLVVDGVMYVTGSWSQVYALDAVTGAKLWKYDPEVEKIWGAKACCDVVNRGVAMWGSRIFVGVLDGRLVALDRDTGEVVWETVTTNQDQAYTITGAPRVVEGNVLIGNGGGEFGVRGYVSAYDAETGDLSWRFHTVPGNPEDGFESDAMKMAADTWTGEWWTMGGGGTVWDSMAYDPALGLLYIGVGNGSPWNQRARSPEGGDNLFLSSIVALRARTGEYVWHYQTTPGETWDFTATQHMILADLPIGSSVRKVIMQAPKNGFFYVLDRVTGELISADNYVPVNWASHVDLESGRPVEAADARYPSGPRLTTPGPFGGHNWHPMSYHPELGLVYIPAHELPHMYGEKAGFSYSPDGWNTAVDFEYASTPENPVDFVQAMSGVQGYISAWDPVQRREVWRVRQPGPWNGGMLSTASNLLFQGNVVGEFAAFNATNGDKLWSFDSQTGITAAPVTFRVDGVQYVSVAVGWGSALAMLAGPATEIMGVQNKSRVLTFKLNGTAQLPPPAMVARVLPEPPASDASEDTIAFGKNEYFDNCFMCHGDSVVSGGMVPDLRYADAQAHEEWNAIVLGGSRSGAGMPGFGSRIGVAESEAIQAYVISRARDAYEKSGGGSGR